MNFLVTLRHLSSGIMVGHRAGGRARVKCKESLAIWPCCNLIIWECRGKELLNVSYQSLFHVHRTHTKKNRYCHNLTHTRHKVLSQHPQIRLHVTFPIKGFLERLNPPRAQTRADIPAFGAKRGLPFLRARPEC